MRDLVTTVVSICQIAILPTFLPVCLIVLWILLKKPEFKSNTAYTVIFWIGVLDCFHMTTSFTGGFMNLFPAFAGILGEFKIGSCVRNGYLAAVPTLELILALNRLTVILRCHCSNVGRAILRAIVMLLALSPIPGLYVLDLINDEIEFSYHEGTYRYRGPALFEKTFIFSRVVMVVATLITYGITVAVIVLQRKLYGSKFKLSRIEFRLLLQALFQSLPLAFVILSGAFLFQEIWKHGLFFVVWGLTAVNLPVIHLLIFLGFNSLARKYLVAWFHSKRPSRLFRAARRVSNVTTISVKSLGK